MIKEKKGVVWDFLTIGDIPWIIKVALLRLRQKRPQCRQPLQLQPQQIQLIFILSGGVWWGFYRFLVWVLLSTHFERLSRLLYSDKKAKNIKQFQVN